MTSGGKRWRR